LGMLNQGFKENRFQVLASLTKMRLLCLHTGLVEEKHNHLPSAKIDELKSRVETLVDEGHSVLIFSQFTSFLKKVREELDEQGLKYVYLDGTTSDRKSVIEQFKQKQALIFLISLKAGGTGLNLIEADYCFLLDPWWNPAVEAQATDRA